jgi:hypothetical protein
MPNYSQVICSKCNRNETPTRQTIFGQHHTNRERLESILTNRKATPITTFDTQAAGNKVRYVVCDAVDTAFNFSLFVEAVRYRSYSFEERLESAKVNSRAAKHVEIPQVGREHCE